MDKEKIQKKKARLIAFYLPQFYPIPENDLWWGKGFTEWTNSSKARPMFRGHYQPRIPADLGYYDLRLPETRIAQAEMAKDYGIEGFCYWHYWFGNGRRLLERPFKEVLESGKPDFPFCLGWANQTWTGIWHGCPNRVLIEQKYPGSKDHEEHFASLVPAFSDKRYIKIDGKPVFVIFDPKNLPNSEELIEIWNRLALCSGFSGIYFIGHKDYLWEPGEHNFDASIQNCFGYALQRMDGSKRHIKRFYRLTGINIDQLYNRLFNKPRIYQYKEFIKHMTLPLRKDIVQYPCVVPNWDNTPRSGWRGVVLKNSNPELWRLHLESAFAQVYDRDYDRRIIFIKSWNEWAEGNYLEPDHKFQKKYLEVVRETIFYS